MHLQCSTWISSWEIKSLLLLSQSDITWSNTHSAVSRLSQQQSKTHSHVLLEGVAGNVNVDVEEAPVSSDICVDHASNTHRLAVETTLSRVREGYLREALVVNTSGAPVTLKHGMRLSPCLAYGTQVVSESAEFPSICVSSIVSLREDHSNSQTPLEPFRQSSIFCQKEKGTN